MSAVQQAADHPCKTGNKYAAVRIGNGVFRLNRPIILKPEHNMIIVKGEGTIEEDQLTHTVLERVEGFNSSTTIRTTGYAEERKFEIIDYEPSSNAIKIGSQKFASGDYVDIQTPNDTLWANSKNSLQPDLLGQIVQVKSQHKPGWYILEDDFSLVWKMAQRAHKKPYLRKIEPAHHIGIENLTIRNSNKVDSTGFLVHITRSSNIWIKSISSGYADNTHVNVTQSTQIEVRDSYFHHASSYGGGGFGYGISFSTRTTNSLIENNRFQRLRHCIVLSRGVSRNVAGYNFCVMQRDGIGNRLGSISIHGNYPFLNLMEGNVIERMLADNYHGKNGPYNTYFRNFTYDGDIVLETGNDSANVLANEGKLVIETPGNRNILDRLKKNKEVPGKSSQKVHSDTSILKSRSYYHTNRPDFLSSDDYSWPPIGPPVKKNDKVSSSIPALDTFCDRFKQVCAVKNVGQIISNE